MKVQVVETVETTDEQRFMLGAVLDWAVKPKRMATRAEFKPFLWEHGSAWASTLEALHQEVPGVAPAVTDADADGADSDEDDDLLGDVTLDDLL